MRLFLLSSIFLALLFSLVLARQPPTSFCKCICFTNSTIIPLNATSLSTSATSQVSKPLHFLSHRSPEDPDPSQDQAKEEEQQQEKEPSSSSSSSSNSKRLTCSDCTRAFCLDQNLPICNGAKEEDVFTTCFQRDSLKDETIVLLFLIVTTGLLGWALIKPWIERVRDTETVRKYAPPIRNLSSGLGVLRRRGGAGGGLPAYRDEGVGRHRATDSGGSESFARQGGLNS